jgi:glyoxylase-like metal-dependent hydrolase (beta-lactamase superfamily II)
MTPAYDVYALRYATSGARQPHENFLTSDPHDQASPLDYFVWLIRAQGREILVDTGFAADAARTRRPTFRAGNLDPLPIARVHLQAREMRYATGRCRCHGRLRHPYTLDDVVTMLRHVYADRVTFHDGEGEVAPGVTVHKIGGHSDGLQVVRVATKRGPVVLASDAAHLYANIARRNPFPIVYNVGDMMEGWRIIEHLAGDPDRIIPGHDPVGCEIYSRVSGAVEAFALHQPPLHRGQS